MAILDEIIEGALAERALTRWARGSRFAGSKDRAAVRDLVFDVLRSRASCLWRSGQGHENGRALLTGLLAGRGAQTLEALSGEGYAPDPLTPAERAALRDDLAAAPAHIRDDHPAFLSAELARSLGARLPGCVGILKQRAPVDLRVNALKSDLDGAISALLEEGITTETIPGLNLGLRVVENARRVSASRAYRFGLVELQDAASQKVAETVSARPGMKVLDLCAGGGGKTLALAANMDGSGQLFAYDANPHRLRGLPERAARAGADITLVDDEHLDSSPENFDIVLIDVPCSGSGAWRRNPDQKWRLTPEMLDGLLTTQAEIFDRAAGLVAPGGTLVYATCSILKSENEDQVDAFLSRRQGFDEATRTRFWPGEPGDGFFSAGLRRALIQL